MGWDGIVQLEGTFRDQWIYSTPVPRPWITLNTAGLELGPGDRAGDHPPARYHPIYYSTLSSAIEPVHHPA